MTPMDKKSSAHKLPGRRRRMNRGKGLVESADGWTTVVVVASHSSTGRQLRKATTTTKPIRTIRGVVVEGGGGGRGKAGQREEGGGGEGCDGGDDEDDDVRSLEEVEADYFRCRQAWEQSDCWRQLSAMLLGLLLPHPRRIDDDGDSGYNDDLQRQVSSSPNQQQQRRSQRQRQQQQHPNDDQELRSMAEDKRTAGVSNGSNGWERSGRPKSDANTSARDTSGSGANPNPSLISGNSGHNSVDGEQQPIDDDVCANRDGDCCATAAMAMKLDTCVCLGLGSLASGSHRGRQTSLYQLACLQSILHILRVYRRGGRHHRHHHHHHQKQHHHNHNRRRRRLSSSQGLDTVLREPRSAPPLSPSPATTAVQGCSYCGGGFRGGKDDDTSSSGRGDDDGGEEDEGDGSCGDYDEDDDDGGHSLRVYAQDPLFTKVDVAFLASLGVEVVPPPAAQAFIGASTFVYAPHCERSFLLPVLVARKAQERRPDDDDGGNCGDTAAAAAVENGNKEDGQDEDDDSAQLVICNDMDSVADGVLTLSAPRSEVLAARRFLQSHQHHHLGQQQEQYHYHHRRRRGRHGSSMSSSPSKSESGRRRRSLAFPVFAQDEYVFNDLCIYWKEDTPQRV